LNHRPRPGLTGSPLERADHIRTDEEALAKVCGDLRARLLRLDDLDPEVDPLGALGWCSLADCPDGCELLFLGLDQGVPCFAALDEAAPSAGQGAYRVWRHLDMLDPAHAATYAAARGLIEWHRRHLHCGRCGTRTRIAKGGWSRACADCGTEQFPRVDPVVIMLAEHDGEALVGRQPRFPPDRYSALAGFVEPGESLEEAARREVLEESGIRVGRVRYQASQPWPFPGSLMIGLLGEAESTEIVVDRTELEDARWFDRDEVCAMLADRHPDGLKVPPAMAIAHHLIRAAVEG
jgi:NAD+ diphosphatase